MGRSCRTPRGESAASSWAHPAPRSAASFQRCYEVVGAADPVAAENGMLVYAYGYELHSVRVDGTHDRTLLRADAPVSSPTLSADGRLIAFDQGATSHEIWLMNRDGSGAHYVTSGTTPAFAPDGAQLAIGGAPTGSGTAALDVIGVDGTGRRTLAVDAAERPEPAWSPDGTRIVFNKNALAPFDVQRVMMVDEDGSNERSFAGGGESAAWSPDGSTVVYSAVFNLDLAKRLYVMSADGAQDHPLGPQSREFDAIAPTWSPDGRKITFILAPSTNAGTEARTACSGRWTRVGAGGIRSRPTAGSGAALPIACTAPSARTGSTGSRATTPSTSAAAVGTSSTAARAATSFAPMHTTWSRAIASSASACGARRGFGSRRVQDELTVTDVDAHRVAFRRTRPRGDGSARSAAIPRSISHPLSPRNGEIKRASASPGAQRRALT